MGFRHRLARLAAAALGFVLGFALGLVLLAALRECIGPEPIVGLGLIAAVVIVLAVAAAPRGGIRFVACRPYLWPALLPGWPSPYGPAEPWRIVSRRLPNSLDD
jgi:hypothetical protein